MIRSRNADPQVKRTALIDEIRELRPQGQTRDELEKLDVLRLNCRLDQIRNEDRRALRARRMAGQAMVGEA